MSADTLTASRMTEERRRTLTVLQTAEFHRGFSREVQVRTDAQILGCGEMHDFRWYRRLASCVAAGWAGVRGGGKYREWKITSAGREALAAHEAGERRG